MQPEFSLVDHLEELRKRLIIVGLSILILGVLSFLVSDFLLRWVTAPILDRVYSLYFFSPYEAFLAKIKVSVAGGIILSLPIIFAQLWQFASPGLYPNEKRMVTVLIGSSTILFLVGVLFAYFVAVPIGLRFFLNFKSSALTPLISLDSYFSFLISFLIAFGIMFDLPVLLIGLIWLGVVKTEFLARQRKLIIIFLFILAAILTPTADVVTQCLLAIPLWLLFELSLWVGYGLEARTGK